MGLADENEMRFDGVESSKKSYSAKHVERIHLYNEYLKPWKLLIKVLLF